MFRQLLRIASRVGVPGTLLTLSSAGGRVLYLEVAMSPVSVVAGLDHDDVLQLHAACSDWLREQDDREPAPFGRPESVPLVGGILGRVVADAGRSTVQVRTVPRDF